MKLFSHISFAVAVLAVFLLSACKLEAPAIFITVAVTGEPTDITEEEAVLHGSARLPEKTPDDLQLGFLLSIDKNVIKSESQEIIVFPEQKKEEEGEATKADGDEDTAVETEVESHDVPAGQEFAVKVVGFEPGTTYYYRSFALCNGFYSYGTVVSFTTLGTPPSQGDTPDDNQDTAPEEGEEVGD